MGVCNYLYYYTEELLKIMVDVLPHKNACACVTLTGGVDSTVIALAARSAGLRIKAYTAFYINSLPKDLPYAIYVARSLGATHELLPISANYALKLSEEVVKLLRTFDPVEVRNDVAALAVLKKAAEDGCEYVLTGDGGDELFAGYTYMAAMTGEELSKYIRYLAKVAHYPTVELGRRLGINVVAPFTAEEVVRVALEVPPGYKRLNPYTGKYILRKIIEALIGPEVAWRPKTPAEEGSGTKALSELYASLASEDDVRALKPLGLRGADRAYLYRIFRKYYPEPPKEVPEGFVRCPYCGFPVPKVTKWCRTCGSYIGN